MKSRKRLLFCIFLFCNIASLFAQDWGRFWCFGDSAGIDFSNPSAPVTFTSYMDSQRSCASVGDSAHGLLMYINEGYYPLYFSGVLNNAVIHNSQNNVMLNADTLIGANFDAFTIVPKPGNDSIFYLFQRGFGPEDGLYFSVIDPYFNNNQGRAVQKNVQLHLADSSLMCNGLLSIKHANGRDWWIICRNWNLSNLFNLFLLTPDSILGPFTQNIGTLTSTNTGLMAVSQQGDKLALVVYNGLIEVYSFDRCTGLIGNTTTISISSPIHFFGTEFSPSGNFLYVSNIDNIFGGDSLRLFQIDLSIPTPHLNKIYADSVPASGGNLRLAPDGKIYFACLYETGWPYPDSIRNMYNENLGMINSPDNLGTNCNFQPFSFYLGGKRSTWELPHNPNYLLGPITGSVCDSLTLGVASIPKEKLFSVYPNPTNGILHVSFKNETLSLAKIVIYNSIGEMVQSVDLGRKKGIGTYDFDLSDAPSGMYLIQGLTESLVLNKKIIKE